MALTLAGVMAMSTLPMSVFAATDATVTVKTTATLAANSDRTKTLFVTSAAGLTADDTSYGSKENSQSAGFEVVNAPVVRVGGILADVDGQDITLEVIMTSAEGNFKWRDKAGSDADIAAAINALSGTTGVTAVRENVTNKLFVTIPAASATTAVSLNIPVVGTVSSNKAPLVATVKPVSTNSNIVTVSTTVATVNESTGGNTTTTTDSSFTGKSNLKFNLLTKENNAGTFGNDSFTATSNEVTTYSLPVLAYADKVTYTATSGFEFDRAGGVTLNNHTYQKVAATFDYGVTGAVYAKIGSSENKLDVVYSVDAPTTVATSIKLADIYFAAPSRTVSLGQDVKVTVAPQGNSDVTKQSDLKVGTYTDYAFSSSLYNSNVTIPTLPAGSLGFVPTDANGNVVGATSTYDADSDIFDTDATDTISEIADLYDDIHETVAIQVKESVPASMIAGRSLEFILPEDVEIVGFDVIFDDKGALGGVYGEYNYTNLPSDVYIDGNVLSFENIVGTTGTSKHTIALKLYVAADANYTGDVDVVVAGGALAGEELKPVTVAKFAPAVAISTTATNVKPGVQATATADITLTETVAGRFQDGETVYVKIDTENYATLDNALNIIAADVDVTEGDLSIKDVKINATKGLVSFKVNGTSSTASTVTLTNVKVSTAYGLPDTNVAPFQVMVTTDQGDETSTNNVSTTSSLASTINFGKLTADYINIKSSTTTGAAAGEVVQIQPGSTTYTVNGVEKTMDVAPFIDAASQSMMVPVRFIADGVGITEESGGLQWSASTKTVVLRNGSEILEFPVGANFYRVNGVKIDNENGAMTQIVDGRTFVPFRTMGNALGIPVSWNDETRTAQYN